MHRMFENLWHACRVTNMFQVFWDWGVPLGCRSLRAKAGHRALGKQMVGHPRYMWAYSFQKMFLMAVGILGFLISVCSICVFVFVGGSGDHGRDNKGRGALPVTSVWLSPNPFLPCLQYWNVSFLPFGPVLSFISRGCWRDIRMRRSSFPWFQGAPLS